MIIDEEGEYWVTIQGDTLLSDVRYFDNLESYAEYYEHWGKWLIFRDAKTIREIAGKLDDYIDAGLIDSAKFNREPSEIGKGESVLCVYCDDRDRERVWTLLLNIGAIKRIWKYDKQTLADWTPGGRLYQQYKAVEE
jgi:hypothetical protein